LDSPSFGQASDTQTFTQFQIHFKVQAVFLILPYILSSSWVTGIF